MIPDKKQPSYDLVHLAGVPAMLDGEVDHIAEAWTLQISANN